MVAKCKFRVGSKVIRTFIVASTFHTTNLSFFGELHPNAALKYIVLFLSI